MSPHAKPMPLDSSSLAPEFKAFLSKISRDGPQEPVWGGMVMRQAASLLHLCQRAGSDRLRLALMEVPDSLRAMLSLKVPVPCSCDGGITLEIADRALLGLTYPREAMLGPLPGTSFVQILSPANVWHPQVGTPGQVLCLGLSMPAGVRITDLVLFAYSALSMQCYQFDELDPAGVLSPVAARWWQANRVHVPLSRETFFKSWTAGIIHGHRLEIWQTSGV